MKNIRFFVSVCFITLIFIFQLANRQIFANGNNILIKKQDFNKEKMDKIYSGNYIGACITQNGYLWRWNNTSFPLKVYIKSQTNTSLPSYFYSDVKKAFQNWQNNSEGILSFVFINNQELADIIVNFQNNALNKQNKGTVLGTTHHGYTNNILDKPVLINLIPYSSNTVYLSSGMIYAVALHEIGHSVGLCHSNSNQDVMTPVKHLTIGKLSRADINSLKLLYSIVPDVTDIPYSKEYRSQYVTTEDIKKYQVK